MPTCNASSHGPVNGEVMTRKSAVNSGGHGRALPLPEVGRGTTSPAESSLAVGATVSYNIGEQGAARTDTEGIIAGSGHHAPCHGQPGRHGGHPACCFAPAVPPRLAVREEFSAASGKSGFGSGAAGRSPACQAADELTMHYSSEPHHTPPQCPVCGATNIVHDELISGERSWRCEECGHEWTSASLRPQVDLPPEG